MTTIIIKRWTLLLILLVGTSVASFAGVAPNPNSVDCARQYKDCLAQCNSQEATAKKNKADCERSARAQYPNGGAQLNAALKDCRDTFNRVMASVAQCRTACKTQYLGCTGGGNEGPP